jgi:tRNA splicing ligase
MLKIKSLRSKVFKTILLTMLLSFGTITISVSAEDLSDIVKEEENRNINKENISSEVLNSSDESEQIGINSKKLPELRGDYFALMARSVDKGPIKGGRQYYNSGNRNAAQRELERLGGTNYEIITVVENGHLKFIKNGSDGTAVLYTSKSSTLGAPRPTIQFQGNKVRFIGD